MKVFGKILIVLAALLSVWLVAASIYPNNYSPNRVYAGWYGRHCRVDNYGWLWTRVEPNYAAVIIDGGYAGRVKDFDGPVHHALVPAGRHRVEFRAPGFRSYAVGVYIRPCVTTAINYELRS